MTTFSTVLDEFCGVLSKVVGTTPPFAEVAAIRDLKGILRVVVVPVTGAPATAVADFQTELTKGLGAWFAPPVLSTVDDDPVRRGIAKALCEQAETWSPKVALSGVALKKLERRLSKDAWTEAKGSPPWPLVKLKEKLVTPPVIAFFSFKGGVGRTTALAGVAQLLAKENDTNKIALVDLDLEAPGLGPLFEVATKRGVLDVLVDHAATDKIDIEDASLPAFGNSQLTVFPASAAGIDDDYLEKLGRLDFSRAASGEGDSPVHRALTAFLKTLKNAKYTHILLDARAGLHDLGGLALQGLAHVDVLVARPSAQTWPGLRFAVKHLRAVRGDAMQLVLAHAQAPLDPSSPEHPDFANETAAIFQDEVYGDSLPGNDGMQTVIPISRHEELAYLKTAADMPTAAFAALHKRIGERVELMCAPDVSTGDEDEAPIL